MADITDINVNGTSYNILDDEGMRYVSSPTNGDVLTTDANGQAVDSGVTLASLSGKQDALTAGDGIDITNGVISNFFQNIGNTDLNTITYNFQGYVWGATNVPTGVTSGFLIALQRTDYLDRAVQYFMPTNVNQVYTRVMYDSTWSTWSALYSAETLTTGTGINITNGVISNTGFDASLNVKSAVDLNTITEAGVYYVNNGTTALHYPSPSGALIVIKDTSAYSRQIYYRHGTLNSADQYWYSRLVNATTGEASDWAMFYNDRSLTAGTGINITDGTISNAFTSLSASDLNDVKSYFAGYCYNASNRPSGASAFGTLVCLAGGGRVSQLYADLYKESALWYRRYYNNAWGSWNRVVTAYCAGDTVTIVHNSSNDIICNGFVTGSAKDIYFHLPLDMPVNASNVTFSSLYILPRGDQGYMAGNSMIDVCADSSYTVTGKPTHGGIKVTVERTTAFTVTNNTPVAIQVRGRTFTFS